MVELILALAVSVLVGTAVAAMLVGVSYGTSSRRDMRDVIVRGETLDGRLAAAVRGAQAVLESGSDYLVLWMSDTRQNEAPDLSEIRLIERAGDNTMKAYGFPSNWTQAQIDAADATYALTGNPAGFFYAAASNAKTAGSFVPTLWASNVTAAAFTPDAASPDVTALVGYQLTLAAGDLSETVIGAASVRARQVE